jgi:HEAT repeat protein
MKINKKTEEDILKELPQNISAPIFCLNKEINYKLRVAARKILVKMGRAILPKLNNLLAIEDNALRWEVAKVIELIGEKESIPVFIKLLEDSDSGIRWIAADGLINIGRESIIPLLKSIINQKEESYFLRLSAHYILTELFNPSEKKKFKSLMQSIQSYGLIGESTVLEVYNALRIIEKQKEKS